jgi:hypothetical protein
MTEKNATKSGKDDPLSVKDFLCFFFINIHYLRNAADLTCLVCNG